MSSPGIVLAFGLSVLPLLLETASGGSLEVRGASRLGIALLPWLALAGVPRASEAGWHLGPLLALPPLALAASVDARGALGWSDLLPALGAGVALIALLAFAAGRGRGVYGVLWTVLVAGLPALGVAFGLSAAAGTPGPPPVLVWIALRTPLGWAWEGARAGSAFASPAFAVGIGALLVAVTVFERRRAGADA